MKRGSWALAAFFTLAGFAAFGDDQTLDLPIEKADLVTPAGPLATSRPGVPAVHVPPPPPPGPPTPPQAVNPSDFDAPPSFFGRDLHPDGGRLVFVIDISGSMSIVEGSLTAGSRLDRAKAELLRAIRSLPASFKFDIVSYDCLYYDWKYELVPATEENKTAASAWTNGLKPGGATGTGPAMSHTLNAYHAAKLVLLLTDGAPNCGAGSGDDQDPACLEAHRSQIHWANIDQHARIDVFGIGAFGAFRQFCITVASDNGGSYTDVR